MVQKVSCHGCGKIISEKDDVRIKYDMEDSMFHKACINKAIVCCVCENDGTSTFRGIAGDLFPVCAQCKPTIIMLDDCMDEGRAATIKEAKRLICEVD